MFQEAITTFRCSVEGLKDICSHLMSLEQQQCQQQEPNETTVMSLQYQRNHGIHLMLRGAMKLCSTTNTRYTSSPQRLQNSTPPPSLPIALHQTFNGGSVTSTTSPGSSVGTSSPSVSSTSVPITIQKISCIRSMDYMNLFNDLSSTSSSSTFINTVLYPIYIDDIECYEILEDPKIGCAIVLYNFALSYRCLSIVLLSKLSSSTTQGVTMFNTTTKIMPSLPMTPSNPTYDPSNTATIMHRRKSTIVSFQSSEMKLLLLSDSILKGRLETNNNPNSQVTAHRSRGNASTTTTNSIENVWLVCLSAIVLSNLYTSHQTYTSLSHQQSHQQQSQQHCCEGQGCHVCMTNTLNSTHCNIDY